MKLSKKKQSKSVRFSLKYLFMIYCLISVLITAAAVGLTVMPSIGKIVRELVQSYVNDFVDSGTQIMKTTYSDVEERVYTIENTCRRFLGEKKDALEEMKPMNLEGPQENIPYVQSESDSYQILSEQLKHYANPEETLDVIIITNAAGEIIASNDDSFLGETVEEDLFQSVIQSDGEITVKTMPGKNNGILTLAFSKAVYVEDEIQGTIVYYTVSDFLYECISELSLNGISKPMIYVLDVNGVTIAHSIKENIGNDTGNESLYPVLEEIKAGNPPAPGVHNMKIAYGSNDSVNVTYKYIEGADWLFVVAALDSQVFHSVTEVNRLFYSNVLLILLVVAVLISLASHSLIKPIRVMNLVIEKVANLDFTLDITEPRFKKAASRKDEIGEIGGSILRMIESIKEKIAGMNESSSRVNEAAANLKQITNEISDKAGDASAITQQLSAGMEETTASTEMITGEIENLKDNVTEIKKQVGDNTVLTEEIKVRAGKMTQQAISSREHAKTTFGEIKTKGELAIEQSKAVNKINELAGSIIEIAEETSLLSLNASIEAARAGEFGRGFAVVADEIGNLAQQSANTVNEITDIVKTINHAVESIIECLNISQHFVEENIYTDYEHMIQILGLYSKDADTIFQAMKLIDGNTNQLVETTSSITRSIQAIHHTIEESSIGISDVATRNSEIGDLTVKSYEMVNDTTKIAAELEETAKSFQL